MKRKYWIDYLRILAALTVVMIHVVYQGTNVDPSIERGTYMLHTSIDIICQFAVPTFVALSGYLILNKEEVTIKYGLSKSLKLICLYFIASVPYAWFETSVMSEDGFSINSFIGCIYRGEYHLWFLPMMCGLYLFAPIIKVIVNKCNMKYIYYVLSIIIVMNLINMISGFAIDQESWQYSAFSFNNSFYVPYANYVWYFIAGYAIGKINFSKLQRIILYVLSLSSTSVAILLTYFISFNAANNKYIFLGNFTISTMIDVVALFVFFKYVISRISVNTVTSKITIVLSKATLPVYLIHVYFLRMLDHKEKYTYWLNGEVQGVPFSLRTIAMNYLCTVTLSLLVGIIIVVLFYLLRKLVVSLPNILMSRRIMRETKKYLA